MSDLAFRAMEFAREKHAGQVRKYTGNPYVDHLAEVAGIVATVAPFGSMRLMVATAWLHDVVEDQGVEIAEIKSLFGPDVAAGVAALSDLEKGNRAERKAASCERLAAADGWIQTIKCADLISSTSSIVQHDPTFAKTYLGEKRTLLSRLTKADPRLHAMATAMSEPTCSTCRGWEAVLVEEIVGRGVRTHWEAPCPECGPKPSESAGKS